MDASEEIGVVADLYGHMKLAVALPPQAPLQGALAILRAMRCQRVRQYAAKVGQRVRIQRQDPVQRASMTRDVGDAGPDVRQQTGLACSDDVENHVADCLTEAGLAFTPCEKPEWKVLDREITILFVRRPHPTRA